MFCAVIPVVISSTILITSSSSRERKLIIQNLTTSAAGYSDKIAGVFDGFATDALITLEGPNVRKFVDGHARGVQSSPELLDTVVKVLQVRVRTLKPIRAALILDNNGVILAADNLSFIGGKTVIPGIRLKRDDAVPQRHVVSNLFYNPSVSAGPLFAVAVPALAGGRHTADLVFIVSADSLQEMIGSFAFFKMFDSGWVTVLDGNDMIASTTSTLLKRGENFAKFKTDSDFDQKVFGPKDENSPESIINYTVSGVKRVGYYSLIDGTGWKILCSVSETDLLRPLKNMIFWNIVFVISVIAVVILIFAAMIRYFTSPIYGLLGAIRALRAGNDDARFKYNEPDEFGEIAATFNDMIDTVQRLMEKEKERSELLLEKSIHDQLTGLYNKSATEELISDYLDNEGKDGTHALFILDIDDFKNINDNLGHYTGDIVLAETAKALKHVSGTDGIAGRIGGDEFMVFFKDISGNDFIKEKAEEILESFKEAGKHVHGAGEISCSIGCSRYPFDADNFEDLYKSADRALYETKHRGKHGYTIAGTQ